MKSVQFPAQSLAGMEPPNPLKIRLLRMDHDEIDVAKRGIISSRVQEFDLEKEKPRCGNRNGVK
jgi:hypothetical protein